MVGGRRVKSRVAGRLADAFLVSKVTPLLLGGALVVGIWSVMTMPSEEEPQIVVPLADVYLPMPGYSPEEIENRALIPLEHIVSGIEGVEYVYAHAEPGFGLVTVRFEVGRDMETSLVQLYSTIFKHADRMPAGMPMPLVKTVTIDDVPFMTVLLSGRDTDQALRPMAEELAVEIETVRDVREATVIGGEVREIEVRLSPERLAAYGIDPRHVVRSLRDANVATDAGEFAWDNEVMRVQAGPFLATADDVRAVVVDVRQGQLVQIGDVAAVDDGFAELSTYTLHGRPGQELDPMIAIAVSKRAAADASVVADEIEARVDELRGRLIPAGVDAFVTRNYGETARDKINTLKAHLLLAILAVGVVVAVTWRRVAARLIAAMGWRAGVVVMTAVPVTFALTLLVYHLFGYTLNRVTLFALIFVTGIVIDDSIIVAENMHRHFSMRGRSLREATIAAVDEVGNPTILATLTVIAAVLPMLFVSGLMGPYMSPMPIGSTVAMTFSLLVALIGTPWLAFRLLPGGRTEEESDYVLEETRIYRIYRRVMDPLLDEPRRIWWALGGVSLLLLLAVGMFPARMVAVKMLPFDDKDEMQIVIDMPEGTTLETTADLATSIARSLASVTEVADVEIYVGTAAPFNFNGMIRHYYLRRGPSVADLQINLVSKGERGDQSHDIARRIRPLVERVVAASETGARVKVVEVPPGPPVLSTLVAEVYGEEPGLQTRVASEVRSAFEVAPDVVDVDWSLADPQTEWRFVVDPEKAGLAGVDRSSVVEALRIGLGGAVATELSTPTSRQSVPVTVRLDEPSRSGVDRLANLHITSRGGSLVPVSDLVTLQKTTVAPVIDRKNGRRVVYVTGEVAGAEESPIYAILDLRRSLAAIELPSGTTLGTLYTRQPGVVEQPVMKWDGEWQVTYEVFRDLGIAFAGALLLIYALIVAWFGSFTTPLVMMAAIPLTLVGIAPGHVAFGAFFTATSMIGMIALAGIMVRNGILLIDYLEARFAAGADLRVSVIEAGAVRTRPIALTAGTVIIGAFVILFDPIFEGLAVSLIAGALASTVLTLVVVPGIYFLMHNEKEE